MSDRTSATHKTSMSKTKGQPNSISMPSFRFNVGDDDLEEIEPEIEEVFKQDEDTNKTIDTPSSTPVQQRMPDVPTPKTSNRSTSLDSTGSPPGCPDSDSKSLFSELKHSVRDKITKTARNLEEKIGMEIPGSAAVLRRRMPLRYDSKGLDIAEVDGSEYDCSSGKLNKSQESQGTSSRSNSPDEFNTSSQKIQSARDEATEDKTASSTSLLTSVPKSSLDENDQAAEDWEFVDSLQPDSEVSGSKPETPKDTIAKPFWFELCQKFSLYGRRNAKLFGLILLFYFVVPLPNFVCGFFVGLFFTCIIGPFIAPYLPEPPSIYSLETGLWLDPSVKSADSTKGVLHKVWMNELSSQTYNPEDYHINQTKSVYIRLQGTSLRITWPKVGMPKRAMWNAPRYAPSFMNSIQHAHYDIYDAQVLLKPQGLPKKRLWSKKYPICVIMKNRSSDVDTNDVNGCSTPATEALEESAIYLFARTGREKELWYRLLKQASSRPQSADVSKASTPCNEHKRSSSSDSFSSIVPQLTLKDFYSHMMSLVNISSDQFEPNPSKKFNVPYDVSWGDTEPPKNVENLPELDATWLNCFIGRVLWDFMTQEDWAKIVADKIQKKLSKIKVPYFIEELALTEIELGNTMPQINKVTKPYMNDSGLWTHFQVSYFGSFCMTLETKLNLMRLKKLNPNIESNGEEAKEFNELDDVSNAVKEERSASIRAQLYDSDAEDSAESSSDEESPTGAEPSVSDSQLSFAARTFDRINIAKEHFKTASLRSSVQALGGSGSASKKILRVVDKIAQSKYFQQATDIKIVKRKMEEVSNTRILLTVEVHKLSGTLAVNIPPPPSDRIWYGFYEKPDIGISARPKLGERQVTMTNITEWIEKKLSLEFQRVLVMPNMDDLIIPVMDAKLS